MNSNFYELFTSIQAVFWVVLFFGGSIFVHELGHFLAARACGLKVDRFSIGFGPRIWTWHRNGVEYCLSLIPFGGYVGLPQLADMRAIEGKRSSKALPEVTYFSKALVLVMGAFFNCIFAAFLAGILWAVGQPVSEAEETLTIGYVVSTFADGLPSPAAEAGLCPGDRVLAVDGEPVIGFTDILNRIVMGIERNAADQPSVTLTVERGGTVFEQTLTPRVVPVYEGSEDVIRRIGIHPAYALRVGEVLEDSPAAKGGLRVGDEITAVDGMPLWSMMALVDHLQQKRDVPVALAVRRQEGAVETLTITPMARPYTQPLLQVKSGELELKLLPLGKEAHLLEATDPLEGFSIFEVSDPEAAGLGMGDKIFGMGSLGDPLTMAKALKDFEGDAVELLVARENGMAELVRFPGPFEVAVVPPKAQTVIGFVHEMPYKMAHVSIWEQFKRSFTMTFSVLKSLVSPRSDIGLQHLMGPPGMVRTLHAFSLTDFRLLLAFVVLMNINLAILNLLPIPVLDGGHLLFATIERVTRRRLPVGLMRRIQEIFMILLFGMMLYVSFFDVKRCSKDHELEKKQEVFQNYFLK
jgi:RIP metalloprotease RseP